VSSTANTAVVPIKLEDKNVEMKKVLLDEGSNNVGGISDIPLRLKDQDKNYNAPKQMTK